MSSTPSPTHSLSSLMNNSPNSNSPSSLPFLSTTSCSDSPSSNPLMVPTENNPLRRHCSTSGSSQNEQLPSLQSLNVLNLRSSPLRFRPPPLSLNSLERNKRSLPWIWDRSIASDDAQVLSAGVAKAPNDQFPETCGRKHHSFPFAARDSLQHQQYHSPSSIAECPVDWITWVPPEAFRALRPEAIPGKDTPSQSGFPASDTRSSFGCEDKTEGSEGSEGSDIISTLTSSLDSPTAHSTSHQRVRRAQSTEKSTSTRPSPYPKSLNSSTSPGKPLRLKPGGGRKKDFFPPNRRLSLATATCMKSVSPTTTTTQSSSLSLPLPFTNQPLRILNSPGSGKGSSPTSTSSHGSTIASRHGSLADIRGGSVDDPTTLMREYTKSRPTSQTSLPAFPFPVPQLPHHQGKACDGFCESSTPSFSTSQTTEVTPQRRIHPPPQHTHSQSTSPVSERGCTIPPPRTSTFENYLGTRAESSPRNENYEGQSGFWRMNGMEDRIDSRGPLTRANECLSRGFTSRDLNSSISLDETHRQYSSTFGTSKFSFPCTNLSTHYTQSTSTQSQTRSQPTSPTHLPNPNYIFPSPVLQQKQKQTNVKATSIAEAARLGTGRELDREERRRIYEESGCPIRGKGLVKRDR